MTFGSLFAGIGGFDKGFDMAGMKCKWQVECDTDALRVLSHHWSAVKRHDDIRTCKRLPKVDVVCGGFPCQDLSVAGNRAGLSGERSGLFWEMVRVIDAVQPAIVVWENVPGLLSSFTPIEQPPPSAVEGCEWEVDEDSDFEAVIGALADIGFYGCVRMLDAQFFSLAQRRERLFGVFARGRSGAGRAAEILALTESSGRNPKTGGKKRERTAATIRGRSANAGVNRPGRGGEDDDNLVYQCHGSNVGPMGTIRAGNGNESGGVPFTLANTLRASDGHHGHSSPRGDGGDNLIVGTLQAHSKKHGHAMTTQQAAESGQLIAFGCNRIGGAQDLGNVTGKNRQDFETETLVAFAQNQRNEVRTTELVGALSSQPGTKQENYCFQTRIGRNGRGQPKDIADNLTSCEGGMHADSKPHVFGGGQMVRRLMPVECLRLQGFADDWLDLNPTLSDSAKYRLIGNAVAVPVAHWIARRIMEANA